MVSGREIIAAIVYSTCSKTGMMTVASTGRLEEADFVALVRDEVPAHVRAELWIGDRQVWSSAVEAGR
jgi:hypothetical protein